MGALVVVRLACGHGATLREKRERRNCSDIPPPYRASMNAGLSGFGQGTCGQARPRGKHPQPNQSTRAHEGSGKPGCESTPHYNRTKVDHGSANAKKGRLSIDVAVVANLAVTWGLFL